MKGSNAWDIRCPNSIKLAGQFIRKLLQPASNYIKPASDFIISLRRNYDCLIGIHARRGDYKDYLDGRYYYSWEKYKTWILELKIILENHGFSKIGFVLCSDEKPSANLLREENIHHRRQQTLYGRPTQSHIMQLQHWPPKFIRNLDFVVWKSTKIHTIQQC